MTHTNNPQSLSALTVTAIIPPMVQLNTPYASLPVLSAYIQDMGHHAQAWDAALDVALSLYSKEGVLRVFAAMDAADVPEAYTEMYANASRYAQIIDPLIHFLQGKDSGLAQRIVHQSFIPHGPRFAALDDDAQAEAFGHMGVHDHARWLATLCIQDLADCWRCSVSPHFALTSYASSVAMSACSFDSIDSHLQQEPDPIEACLLALCAERDLASQDLIILSVPFPGNLIAALRIGQWCKQQRPDIRIIMGGGYANTELRTLSDPRIFAYIDAISLDDGYVPLQAYCTRMQVEVQHVAGNTDNALPALCNTFTCENGKVVFQAGDNTFTHSTLPTPDYSSIDMSRYVDLFDTWNPMQRLWNEGRWLKLVAAHGCYWKKCSFCDTSVPYIQDFQPQRAQTLANRMDELHQQTGLSGFHFTDEAAPPSLMLGLAIELLRRGRSYHWWANIRFDTYFTPDRARVLASAGLMAVSGGLEVADDYHLQRINKGISIQQATQVTHALRSAGIMVHAYLMYGFPGQTPQDTIDSMEVVRQLYINDCVQSGFWHRFTCTAHSDVGRNPDRYGVRITGPAAQGFAWNNLTHEEHVAVNHSIFDDGLPSALYHWQRGEGFEEPLNEWFTHDMPATHIDPEFIADIIESFQTSAQDCSADAALLWLGGALTLTPTGIALSNERGQHITLPLNALHAEKLLETINSAQPTAVASKRRLPQWENVSDQDFDMLAPHGLVLV